MPRENKSEPKQVVYLFGAGATQAEVEYLGVANVNLLMGDHASNEGIAKRVLKEDEKLYRSFSRENIDIDIEKLISLLSGSGIASYANKAELLRKKYFDKILEGIIEGKVVNQLKLTQSLLDLHNGKKYSSIEKLSGVLTTNHDGLIQIASQKAFGKVNLGFPFLSNDITPSCDIESPPIIQLHGSFTWKFGIPIKVTSLQKGIEYSSDTRWIPPTINKESRNYPFNKLNAIAYELLSKKCDVLRIIGSSLTQNDWNILSLIFNSQRHRRFVKKYTPYSVELIMPMSAADNIWKQCSYIENIIPIGYLSEGKFDELKEQTQPSIMNNPFFYWLKEKIFYHFNRNEIDPNEITSGMNEVAGGLV
ncbi:MAG: SIR2 family protein [Candidatus Aminicenantales bacterium]